MQYIDFGKTGMKVSRFGMGCMRFPRKMSSDGRMAYDREAAIEMIRYAAGHGVNYFDTAYAYDDSEEILGLALQGGWREKVRIATKLPVWKANTYEDYGILLEEELERLKVKYIDILLFHNLIQTNWSGVKKLGGLEFLEEARAKGKILHKGFSCHAKYEVFEEVVDASNWDMCLIQLNYMDENHQAGIRGLKYAAAKGLAVVIMEPLHGGTLAAGIPAEVQQIWDRAKVKRSPAEWGFRYLYNMPEVSVILSGVSSLEQLEDNIRIFGNAGINVMDEEEKTLIKEARRVYEERMSVRCTGCRYCMPCPQKVDIPEIFKIYNDITVVNDLPHARGAYSDVVLSAGIGAKNCIECGACESACPQNLPIIEKLREAHEVLTK